MKISLPQKHILSAIVMLSLVQFACGLGASQAVAPTNVPILSTDTVAPPTQAATSAPTEAAATKSERGTPDEAKAMLQAAVEHYNAVGRDQALADFNNKVPPFSTVISMWSVLVLVE
jgi:hypothetical protein